MNFDEEALRAAEHAWFADQTTSQAAAAVISAYLKATDSVIVPRYKRDSAVALLMGLSAYWDEQGDTTQAEFVESIAKALTQEGEE